MDKIIDGRALRDQILKELKTKIEQKNLEPKLAIVQVGDEAASARYIEQKKKSGEEIGAVVVHYKLSGKTSFLEIKKLIARLNRDKSTTGIIVQLPLPEHLEKVKVLELVSKEKDVDGLASDSLFEPATPLGVLEILEKYHVPIKNKIAVVIGQSNLVGAPLSTMLEEKGAKIIRIDIHTPKPIDSLVQQGDIVVSSVGKANLINANMIKAGAVVIDVGTNLDQKTGKLTGDVDFDKVKEKASLITPVPGGVGPLTVAMLLKNLVQASENQAS